MSSNQAINSFTKATGNELDNTHLIGYLTDMPYKALVKIFGKEHDKNPHDNTKAQWDIILNDGTALSIYDWKQENPKTKITTWNVGGIRESDIAKLNSYLQFQAKA